MRAGFLRRWRSSDSPTWRSSSPPAASRSGLSPAGMSRRAPLLWHDGRFVRVLFAMALLPLLSGCLAYHRGPMPGDPAGASFAEVDGVRLRFLDVGQGPAVVLVHGYASSLDTWAGVVPVLARHHRVLAVDLKGFGWSDRPRGDYSPQAQARLVLDVLSQRGVDRAAWVGHSWGASVVMAAALAEPRRITRVALYDAWVYEE